MHSFTQRCSQWNWLCHCARVWFKFYPALTDSKNSCGNSFRSRQESRTHIHTHLTTPLHAKHGQCDWDPFLFNCMVFSAPSCCWIDFINRPTDWKCVLHGLPCCIFHLFTKFLMRYENADNYDQLTKNYESNYNGLHYIRACRLSRSRFTPPLLQKNLCSSGKASY